MARIEVKCPKCGETKVIIMDNASWHRKSTLEQITKFYSYSIIWLPSYSPDKNPIEHLWANLKFWLQYRIKDYPTLQLPIVDYFRFH